MTNPRVLNNLPWEYLDSAIDGRLRYVCDVESGVVGYYDSISPEDAQYAVLAVNNHEKLVYALQKLLGHPGNVGWRRECHALLAQITEEDV